MTLKSLAEHDAEVQVARDVEASARRALWETISAPRPNGIACPTCGSELLDTRGAVTVMTTEGIAMDADVHCTACGFTGKRLL